MHEAWAWAARPSAHIWALDIVVDIFNGNAIEVKIAGEKKPHKLLQSLGEMRMGARKKNLNQNAVEIELAGKEKEQRLSLNSN